MSVEKQEAAGCEGLGVIRQGQSSVAEASFFIEHLGPCCCQWATALQPAGRLHRQCL